MGEVLDKISSWFLSSHSYFKIVFSILVVIVMKFIYYSYLWNDVDSNIRDNFDNDNENYDDNKNETMMTTITRLLVIENVCTRQ